MPIAKVRVMSRLLVVPVIATALVSLPGTSSASSDRDEKAADIVATAPQGEPLEVVVTSRSADGTPVISTVLADTRATARGLVAKALGRSSTVGAEMNHRVSIDASYNDTFRPQQYALTALKAETVNKSSTGRGVTVAVIDTGVKDNHKDLAGNVLSGIDYVDPGTRASDENGHGTHVAGIISAVANNKRGIAGLAPKAKILPVRVLGRDGSGSSADVAKGILYAASRSKVINLSLGSTSQSTAIRTAVAEAIRKNVLVIAAAGNRGCGLFGGATEYPAAYPGVVGVAAVTQSMRRASYSSCGSWVDVAAPGDRIISTMTQSSVGLGCAQGAGADYCYLSGTSFSAPYVAAAGALAISRRGWSQSTVASRLQSTAQDIDRAGRDNNTGAGFINPLRLINP